MLVLNMSEMPDSLALYERIDAKKKVSIVSIPTELGSDARGLSGAPQYLLDAGLAHMLTSVGHVPSATAVVACPPAPERATGALKNLDAVAEVAGRSREVVAQAIARDEVVVALGGDHSISCGTIRGVAEAGGPLGVIWIDAHADLHTPETTLSGNIHGMPAAVALGQGEPGLVSIGSKNILPEHFLHIGLKDLDQAEIDFLRREKMAAVTMYDLAKHGLEPAIAAVDALRNKVSRVWVSMDMDSIDEHYAPGVAMHTHGGFTRREILTFTRYIGKTCAIAGLDVVEMVPTKDIEGRTAKLALEIIAHLLGGEAGWYAQYMEQYSHR